MGRELLTLRQRGWRAQRPDGDHELREPRIALASLWAGRAKYSPTPGPTVLLYPEGFAILPRARARLQVGASAVTPLAPVLLGWDLAHPGVHQELFSPALRQGPPCPQGCPTPWG